MTPRLAGRLLYIADLAHRQAAMEFGRHPMNALAYRVLAKRLHSALAGQITLQLAQGFPELAPGMLPMVVEALEARHFDEHGVLEGPMAGDAQAHAQALLARLRLPRTGTR